MLIEQFTSYTITRICHLTLVSQSRIVFTPCDLITKLSNGFIANNSRFPKYTSSLAQITTHK